MGMRGEESPNTCSSTWKEDRVESQSTKASPLGSSLRMKELSAVLMRSGRMQRSTSILRKGCLSSSAQSSGIFSSSGVTWLNHSWKRGLASTMSAGSLLNSSTSASAHRLYQADLDSHATGHSSSTLLLGRSRKLSSSGLKSSPPMMPRRIRLKVSSASTMSLWLSNRPREIHVYTVSRSVSRSSCTRCSDSSASGARSMAL
mmetsp:Transcript_28595/g.92754  ORF Transcript_28595/g.92754 Transcript_28595/m.92754 type:complete len:202 (+) Transcript_28595:298-903(+)